MEAKDKKPSIFDRFARNIIVFYLILVIVGYLSTLCYYDIFGIDVTDYFVTEDYVNVFFNLLPLLGIFPILIIFEVIYLFSKDEKDGSLKKFDFNFLSTISYKVKGSGFIRFKTNIKRFLVYSCIVCIISIILYFFPFKIKDYCLITIVASLGFIFMEGVVFIMIRFHELKISKFYPMDLFITLLITASSLVVFFIAFISGHSLLNSKVNNQRMTFHFITGNSVKTSDSTLYLGKSKDYIFLYSKPEKKTFIYTRSRIELIEKEEKKKPSAK